MSDELADGWAMAPLVDACVINPPKPPVDALPPDTPVTFVPMPAVDAEQGTIANPLPRPFLDVRKGFTAFRNEDVIMAKITPCMENGKAAIARGLLNGLGFGSTEFHVLRSVGAVLPEYVYYFVRQESFRRAAEQEMTGSVGQKRVPAAFLETTEIPIPPLPEQQRIVAKVEALLARVNAARQRLAKVPAILKRFRQSVLAAACSGRLTADLRLADVVGLDEILNGWHQEKLEALLSEPLANGRSVVDAIGLGFPVLRLTALRGGKIDLRQRKLGDWSIEDAKPFLVTRGDFLVSRGNGSLNLVGRGGLIVEEPDQVAYPDTLIRIRPDKTRILPEFLALTWAAPIIREQIEDAAHTTAGIHKVSQKDLRAINLPLPPLAEQYEIVRRVEALFKLADTIEKQVAVATARVEKLTQAILAKAFRGELVPTEAELARREGRDYEPASVLLERIRAERAGQANGKKKPGKRAVRRRKSAD
ncbi:MAG: restriction endonuclease subunit S [Gemmataceae bacterium]|nr:restriction endonuclease subunit S [Gemmataceae bacterium]